MGNHTKKLILLLFFFSVYCPQGFTLDAQKDGPVYGDPQGLDRVNKLEEKLHVMSVRKDHPRIFITPETLDIYRARAKIRHYDAFNDILTLAEKGNVVNLAFSYLMLEKDNPQSAALCAKKAIKILIENDPYSGDKRFIDQEIAKMGLAFDWIYNAMTEDEIKTVVERLSKFSEIDKRAEDIRKGYKETGETFHREEWVFNSYKAWPEIALAHHNLNADLVYKSRWKYDWYWGDAARMYAYAADGTPFEGYYYGADGVDWFMALKSATGINLIDGEFGWCKNAAYQLLYRLDLERGREIFHHGVAQGAGGCVSYKEGTVAWKMKHWFGKTLILANDNPYINWILNNTEIPASHWVLTTVGIGGMDELKGIAKILFEDVSLKSKSIKDADYNDLPLARLFPGGNEVYMRTGWLGRPVCVGFRSSPAYTKTSHGDFDVNTFIIYKDGVLSPDSGVYDSEHINHFRYQKNTIAHNDILIIDPLRPDEPRKLVGGTPDPGGVDRVFTRTFGAPSRFGLEDAFLHNPQADWAKIIDFKTTPQYDFAIGDATKAYSSRLQEFIRSLAFIRKRNSAYLIIFDRIESKSPVYIKKSLIHLVSEPKITGSLIKSKIPGHYEIFHADFFEAGNVFQTAKIFCKILLPQEKNIAKIGGDGFEFLVEGSGMKNYPIQESDLKRIEEQMGGKWEEIGTWRIEIKPVKQQKRDYFMQVMYITDFQDSFNPENVSLKEEGNYFTANIKDDVLKDIAIKFSKTGKLEVRVDMPDAVIPQAHE